MSERDDLSDRLNTNLGHIEAVLQELLDRLDGLQQDLPLHQRGVMEEPPV